MVTTVWGVFTCTVPCKFNTLHLTAARTRLAVGPGVVRGAHTLVRFPAVSSVQASRFARHPLAATAEVPRRTVAGSPLEVTHASVLTGTWLAGCCNNRSYRYVEVLWSARKHYRQQRHSLPGLRCTRIRDEREEICGTRRKEGKRDGKQKRERRGG